jgi:carbonic anhydrase
MPPREAKEKLIAGNRRYTENSLTSPQRMGEDRRRELTGGQSPFAAILCCADSRVPPEHIFDAALGELFVCRNAGNLIDEATLGSIEYAVAHTGCPLVCVMGHNSCGAVGAAVAAAKDPSLHETPNVDDIVRRLLPAVIATQKEGQSHTEWVNAAAVRNVKDSCGHTLQRSPLIEGKVDRGECAVVGAWYDLASGKVELLD